MSTYLVTVSASHVAPEYRLDNAEIRVSAARGPFGAETVFYASAPKFGCGRNCHTPADAIRSLLSDNGCSDIRVGRVAVPQDDGGPTLDSHTGDTIAPETAVERDAAIAFALRASALDADAAASVMRVSRDEAWQECFGSRLDVAKWILDSLRLLGAGLFSIRSGGRDKAFCFVSRNYSVVCPESVFDPRAVNPYRFEVFLADGSRTTVESDKPGFRTELFRSRIQDGTPRRFSMRGFVDGRRFEVVESAGFQHEVTLWTNGRTIPESQLPTLREAVTRAYFAARAIESRSGAIGASLAAAEAPAAVPQAPEPAAAGAPSQADFEAIRAALIDSAALLDVWESGRINPTTRGQTRATVQQCRDALAKLPAAR